MKTECVYLLVVLALAVFAGTSDAQLSGAEIKDPPTSIAVGDTANLTCEATGATDINAVTYTWNKGADVMTEVTKIIAFKPVALDVGTAKIKCTAKEGSTEKPSFEVSIKVYHKVTVNLTGKAEAKVNEEVELTCSADKDTTGYTYTWAVDPSGATGSAIKNKYTVSSKKAGNVKVTCTAKNTDKMGDSIFTIKFNGAPAFKLGLGISLPLMIAAVSALKLW